MAGQLKVGGNIIASHSGVEGAGEVTLQNVTLGDSAVPSRSMNFRNRIINGDMRIWQRSEDNENSNNSWGFFTADRWFTNKSRVRLVSETLDGVSISAMEISPSSGTYNGGRGVLQKIEDKSVCEKQTVFSAYVRASTNSTVEFGRIYDPGSGSTVTTGTNINVTTTFQRFYVINPIASTTDHLQQYILTGLENGVTYTIANVQLEEGTVPTPFEHRPIGTELALCQRYYFKDPASIYYPAILDGNASDYPVAWFYLPVEMRASPTVGALAISSFYYNNGGSASFTPSGGTPGYNGNRFKGIFVLSQITNPPGTAHAQKLGQWNLQLEFKAEL